MQTATFGPWLKTRRKELDLTRAGLASQMGYAAVTLEKIERDLRRPSKQVAEALAQALSIPEDARPEFIRLARAGEAPLPDGEAPRPKASTPATNLPTPLTSFIDRVSELADVRGRLLKPDVRLLTLVGPPGVGKTRLSIHTGQTVLDQFADGVWFVPLAPISDPALVLPAIARVFDIAEGGTGSLLERLQAHLRSRQMLLILDNFEHLPDAAPHVADVLKACARVKVLATSRVPMRVYGEQEYSLPALALPPQGARLSPQQLSKFDAVKLFVARVQAFQSNFRLDADAAPVVVDICARLDGMPLAIELAAAQMRRFTPQALCAALNNAPLQMLAANTRDVEPRQRTLSGAIQWSYDLLSPAERAAFNRMGVFVGGCTTEAALAVCELADDALMHALADRSLLKRDATERWAMLEMIREFALDALAQVSGDALERAQQWHAEYFARLLKVENLKDDAARFLHLIDVEQHNARAALRWLLDNKHPLAGELARFMSGYFDRIGLQNEGRRTLAEVLSADIEFAPVTHNELLSWASLFALQQNDLKAGLRYADKALADAQAMNSQPLIADRLSVLAYFYIAADDYAQAKQIALEALKIGRTIQHPESIVCALDALGQVALELGDVSEAGASFEEAYTLCQAPDWGHDFYAGLTCAGMGEIALSRHEFDRAQRFLQEGLARNRVVELKLSILNSLAGVIGTMPRQTTADVCRAATIWGAAEALNEKMGLVNGPGDRRRTDTLIAEARSRINPKTFAAAWAEGRELSLDEAIALAMMD